MRGGERGRRGGPGQLFEATCARQVFAGAAAAGLVVIMVVIVTVWVSVGAVIGAVTMRMVVVFVSVRVAGKVIVGDHVGLFICQRQE